MATSPEADIAKRHGHWVVSRGQVWALELRETQVKNLASLPSFTALDKSLSDVRGPNLYVQGTYTAY